MRCHETRGKGRRVLNETETEKETQTDRQRYTDKERGRKTHTERDTD